VWIIALWALGTLALAYITYTSPAPANSTIFIEIVKIVFLSLGGLGVVMPTYINAVNAIEARGTEKLENTFKLIEQWDDPHIFAARKFTRELKKRKDSLSDNDLVSEIDNDEDLKQSVILLMNFFDRIRMSAETGRIDTALFNRSLGPVMSDYHHRMRPYIASQGELYGAKDKFLADWDRVLEISKIK
jgi:hypothetical protein